VVVSDLAPKTTGMRQVDQQRSLELAQLAWEWARQLLREGGHFLVKVFEGPDTSALAAVLKRNFSLCLLPASYPPPREMCLLLKQGPAVPGTKSVPSAMAQRSTLSHEIHREAVANRPYGGFSQ
jgi:hypothetical protein